MRERCCRREVEGESSNSLKEWWYNSHVRKHIQHYVSSTSELRGIYRLTAQKTGFQQIRVVNNKEDMSLFFNEREFMRSFSVSTANCERSTVLLNHTNEVTNTIKVKCMTYCCKQLTHLGAAWGIESTAARNYPIVSKGRRIAEVYFFHFEEWVTNKR